MKKNNKVLYSFKKALKVIYSCENEIQLAVAKKFCSNFLTFYSKYVGDNKYQATALVAKAYNRLIDRHNFMKKTFKKVG
tara:strand:+ start:405 stop:641 length:237 start_codon:yes stop_codon:yes gene_type:complete